MECDGLESEGEQVRRGRPAVCCFAVHSCGDVVVTSSPVWDQLCVCVCVLEGDRCSCRVVNNVSVVCMCGGLVVLRPAHEV